MTWLIEKLPAWIVPGEEGVASGPGVTICTPAAPTMVDGGVPDPLPELPTV
jgi:hypothetical protein